MTTERRLDHLEEGLSPKEGTLLWLQEAHEHGSLVAYCGWLVDRPFAEAPLVRLQEQALTAVRRSMRGEPLERRYAAEEQADRDVAFLVELVMVLNATAEEMLLYGGLRYGMLFWEMRAISAEVRADGPDTGRTTSAGRWARWRANAAALRSELSVKARAFELLESRYLDGHTALFPDTVGRWDRLRETVEDLARLRDGLDGTHAGPDDHARSDLDGISAQDRIDTEAEAERIIDTVRAQALDILGDIEGSAAVLAPYLRGATRAVV